MTVVEVEEALRAAYEEHYVPLLRLCVLLCGDRQVAEDIVQDAFVKIAPRIGEVAPPQLGPYLRRVSRRRQPGGPSGSSFGGAPTPEEATGVRRPPLLRRPARTRGGLAARVLHRNREEPDQPGAGSTEEGVRR